jgi:hypothetical protein
MSRAVRILALALTLVLCILASHTPASADTAVSHLCGPDFGGCEVDQDCVAYCQPCNKSGTCVVWQRRSLGDVKICRCD